MYKPTLRSEGLAVLWIRNLHHLIRWQRKMKTDVKHLWLTYWCAFCWCKTFLWHKQHEIWFECLHHDQIYCQWLPIYFHGQIYCHSFLLKVWTEICTYTELTFFGSWTIAIHLLSPPWYLKYHQILDPCSILRNVIHVWED